MKIAWKFFNHLIFGALLLLIFSCEYQNDDVYLADINKNVPEADLTIDLNLTSDTVYFYKTPIIDLQLKLTNKKLYSVKFYLDNIEATNTIKYGDYSYSLSVDLSAKLKTKLKAVITTSTETGSIADVLEQETYQYITKEWTLIYVPDPLKLTYGVENGRLKISWNKIKSNRPVMYYISTSGMLDSTYNNWYIDSIFVGGNNPVSVTCKNSSISGFAISGNIDYPLQPPSLNNTDSFLISWKPCTFYQNIIGYTVYEKNKVELGTDKLQYTYKSGIIGNYEIVSVYMRLKKYISYNEFSLGNVYGLYPASFLPANAIPNFPVAGKYIYYHLWDNSIPYLRRFDPATKNTLSSLTLEGNIEYYAISPNDVYVVYERNGIINVLNSDGLKLINTFPRSQIASGKFLDIKLSDIYTAVYNDYNIGRLVKVNLTNGSVITEIPAPGGSDFKISADGNYLFSSKYNALYQFNNNTYSTIWSESNNGGKYIYYQFFPDNSGKMVLYNGINMEIRSCSDFSLIRSFSLDNRTLKNVDFNTNKILTVSNLSYYIYSLTDGHLIKELSVKNYNYSATLFNNIIYVDDKVACNLKGL